MCLAVIERTYPQSIAGGISIEGIGYKIFYQDETSLYGEWINNLNNKRQISLTNNRPVGKWLKEGDYRQLSDKHKKKLRSYPFGFHVFRNLKDAITLGKGRYNRVIKKVEYRKVVASGYQRWYGRQVIPVIVAKEIKIL